MLAGDGNLGNAYLGVLSGPTFFGPPSADVISGSPRPQSDVDTHDVLKKQSNLRIDHDEAVSCVATHHYSHYLTAP